MKLIVHPKPDKVSLIHITHIRANFLSHTHTHMHAEREDKNLMKLIVHPKTDKEAVIHDTPRTHTHILFFSHTHNTHMLSERIRPS